MFLQEFGRIEAEAFLTLASELIEEDGIVTAEEDAKLKEYIEASGIRGFTYDAAAAAAARDTLAQLNETSKRKAYMELFSFAICDRIEAPEERRALNDLKEALALSAEVCNMLEEAVEKLYAAYDVIEAALEYEEEAPAEEAPAEEAAEEAVSAETDAAAQETAE